MRDYQTKSNLGALPDSNSPNKYGSGEATSLRTEAKTAVSRAGLTLAPQDGTGEETDQLAQAMLINGVAAQAVQDSGAADAIVLTPVSGSSGLTLPPDYATLDGAEFSFFAAFANATTTPTASIGQTVGGQFGAKTIVREDGAALVAGDIDPSVMTTVRRDGSNDRWLLIRGAGTQGGGFDGSVVSLGTRASNGSWVLGGLTIGKPVFITGECFNVADFTAQYRVTAGTSGNNQSGLSDRLWTFQSTTTWTLRSNGGAVVIPNATSLTIEVSGITAGRGQLEAFQ